MTCDPSAKQKVDLLRSRALLEIEAGNWSSAVTPLQEALRLEPEDVETREFLEEVLIREARYDEALRLLESTKNPTSVELHRKSWLQAPDERAKPPEKVDKVLHPLYGTRAIDDVLVQCIGHIPDEIKTELTAFHAREFSGHHLTFQTASTSPPTETFEELRDLVDVGAKPSWASSSALQLIAAKPERYSPYSAGIGMPTMIVLSLTPDDPFQATVTAHELYHSLLDLNHTNGTEGPDDPGSVMGPWGLRTPLKATYISEFHRKCCTTTAEVQALVDAQEWEQALAKDPNYLALYRKTADLYLSRRKPDKAVQCLEDWVKLDPGPEAMSQLGELLIQLGRDPGKMFRSCRGFGVAANTHLYLAQCYLNCHSFRGALDQLEQAQALEPENLHIGGMMGWALHGLGRVDEAVKLYEATLDRCPGWESVAGRLAWIQREEYLAPYSDEELLWLEALTATDSFQILAKLGEPSMAKLLLQQGVHLYKIDKRVVAEQVFEKLVERKPYTLEAQAASAWLYFLQGREEESRLAAEDVLHFWPSEPACSHLWSVLTSS